ncbi:DegV family protein [Microbulbifer hydrolyticus]|uniref:DegV family EDD domain-containing protein n=1 Tax=Microbulbifer hydrolyticus TaxID=48074 RepID=A0A6P1TAD2_9GAMM|nr:DegV family protein [Microbulbifer hydrolyticus]MBB5210837.1 DegV family protein with EDD domain [Microbulbifer hydrolyticus]QHQ38731.1 DegV family EDD domain-containing protein [Microbulbifer hydrolyticus]
MVQLVVDSGCDLPDEFLRKYQIPVLPHHVSVGKDAFGDQRNPAQMAHFYSLSLVDRSRHVTSGPADEDVIEQVLSKLQAQGHKDIVVQTINSTNSPTFANAQNVAQKLGSEASKIHVVDSHALFSGQGLLALYTLSLIQRGLNGAQIKSRAEEFGRKVVGYAAIKDVYYLRERGRQKNEKSVSWLKAFMARSLNLHPIVSMTYQGSAVADTVKTYDGCTQRLFELAAEKIRAGQLLMPAIVVSIAGPLKDLEKVPGFKELEALAAEHKVKIYRSVMSLSGGINLGPGTVALAVATK